VIEMGKLSIALAEYDTLNQFAIWVRRMLLFFFSFRLGSRLGGEKPMLTTIYFSAELSTPVDIQHTVFRR
jgi:hypothetical protein